MIQSMDYSIYRVSECRERVDAREALAMRVCGEGSVKESSIDQHAMLERERERATGGTKIRRLIAGWVECDGATVDGD